MRAVTRKEAAKQLSPTEVEIHHLKLALQGMLDAFYRLTDPLPTKTLLHGHCMAAFGNIPELAAGLLK